MYIEPSLLEFSAARNAEVGCSLKAQVTHAAWLVSYNEPVDDPSLFAAAAILLEAYTPKPTQLQVSVAYAQGDDNLYPIDECNRW